MVMQSGLWKLRFTNSFSFTGNWFTNKFTPHNSPVWNSRSWRVIN